MSNRARSRWGGATLAVALTAALLRTLVFDLLTVSSESMDPTLCTGGIIVTTRHVAADSVRVDDIVTFASPLDGARTIKRVVAVAGQQVGLRDAVLVVDGSAVDEPWVDHRSIDGVFSETVTVPPGSVYVLGDRRELSVDSRVFGPVGIGSLTGRLVVTLRSGCD